MKMSDIGRAVLMAREGVRLQTYLDSKKIPTIGCGHTAACGAPIPKMGMLISQEECDAILARDLAIFERAIEAAIRVPYTQNEFDALVSLAFNCGAGAIAKSTAVRRLNEGNRKAAAAGILLWDKPSELIPRRQAEAQQFLTPYEKGLPKARSTDKAPIKAPAVKVAPKPVAPAPGVAAATPGILARFLSAFSSRS